MSTKITLARPPSVNTKEVEKAQDYLNKATHDGKLDFREASTLTDTFYDVFANDNANLGILWDLAEGNFAGIKATTDAKNELEDFYNQVHNPGTN